MAAPRRFACIEIPRCRTGLSPQRQRYRNSAASRSRVSSVAGSTAIQHRTATCCVGERMAVDVEALDAVGTLRGSRRDARSPDARSPSLVAAWQAQHIRVRADMARDQFCCPSRMQRNSAPVQSTRPRRTPGIGRSLAESAAPGTGSGSAVPRWISGPSNNSGPSQGGPNATSTSGPVFRDTGVPKRTKPPCGCHE